MLKSKKFRVAREGATVDGRNITAQQIDQMAANYNPDKYGARIWLEHFRGLFPDSIFKALGDVESLSAETDDEGKRVLFAVISPTSDLVEMNKQRQKVFTSIEMDPSFSDSNEAYMVGLAVTDTPASLGTEMLQFSRQDKGFAEKFGQELTDKLGENLYSTSLETTLELAEEEPEKPSLFSKVKELLGKKSRSDDQRFNDINESVLAIAESQQQLTETVESLSAQDDDGTESETVQKLNKQLSDLQEEFNQLKSQLENNPDQNHHKRPPSTGGGDKQLAEC